MVCRNFNAYKQHLMQHRGTFKSHITRRSGSKQNRILKIYANINQSLSQGRKQKGVGHSPAYLQRQEVTQQIYSNNKGNAGKNKGEETMTFRRNAKNEAANGQYLNIFPRFAPRVAQQPDINLYRSQTKQRRFFERTQYSSQPSNSKARNQSAKIIKGLIFRDPTMKQYMEKGGKYAGNGDRIVQQAIIQHKLKTASNHQTVRSTYHQRVKNDTNKQSSILKIIIFSKGIVLRNKY